MVDTSTQAMDDASSTTSSVAGDGAPKFQISLVPLEDEGSRQWMFRCDTEELMMEWLSVMRVISPGSFPPQGSYNNV